VLPISQRAWTLMLAGGCAWWVALAFGRTERMAEMIGVSPSEVRALGVRDVASGLQLALSPDRRTAIATRVAFDLADAARYGRGRPAVLAMTAGFAAVGALGFLTRSG
jgi:hypothetical protein